MDFLDILNRFMIGRVRIVLIPHFGDIVIGKGMKGGWNRKSRIIYPSRRSQGQSRLFIKYSSRVYSSIW